MDTNTAASLLAPKLTSGSTSIDEWRPWIPDSAVTARQRYRLASVKCDTPLLMLPIEGQKQLSFAGQTYRCDVAEYLMLHTAVDVSIENIPPDKGVYRAWIIAFPWRVVASTRHLILAAEGSIAPKPNTNPISQSPLSPKLFEALGRYLRQLKQPLSAAENDLSLVNILVALYAEGASGFLAASTPSIASRIRMMVSENPRHDWCSSEFESLFHISGATLRRRLAIENTSLRLVVREARLLVALSLLQTTRRPVKSIAADCGYLSQSSFRENFVEQFGVSPSTIANT